MNAHLVDELERVLNREPLDLARAALTIARIEYPDLRLESTLDVLSRLGDHAALRIQSAGASSVRDRVRVLNDVLFREERFSGNAAQYYDFRNSLLNDVVARRLGIPISLALVYTEVARLSGVTALGISFPGHFLIRIPDDAGTEGREALVLDPFDDGRELTSRDCDALLKRHVGETARFTRALLGPCTGRQWLARMLTNLKRIYVDLRSFPHARLAADLLFTVEPTVGSELRDRGLIAYQLDDYPAALRDLEEYLRLRRWRKDDRDEHRLLTEQVNVIRGRVAGLN